MAKILASDSITLVRVDDGAQGTQGINLLPDSAQERTGANEFVKYADLAPIFDKYGIREYTISFDIKSKDTSTRSTVQVYMQNGSGARYSFSKSVPVTTEYTRQKVIVTPKLQNPELEESWLAFYGTYKTGNIPTVKNVKVEFGSVSDPVWTPAPEDADAKIEEFRLTVDTKLDEFQHTEDEFRSQLSEVTTTVTVAKADVEAAKERLDDTDKSIADAVKSIADAEGRLNGLDATVESVNAKTSQIEQQAGSIEQSVSETQERLNNLRIGARNLFQGSEFTAETVDNSWIAQSTGGAPPRKVVEKDGYKCVQLGCKADGYIWFHQQYGADNQALPFENSHSGSVHPLQTGVSYTVTVKAKVENYKAANDQAAPPSILVGMYYTLNGVQKNQSAVTIDGDPTIPTDGNWHDIRQTFRFDLPEGATHTPERSQIGFFISYATCDLYLYHPMFELGSVPSDWTPAPEDLDIAISTVETHASKIEEKANSIELSVQEVTEKTTQLGTDISSAQSSIKQLSDSITNKVSKDDFNSEVKQLSDSITNKVSKGDLSSEISQEAGAINIQSNRLTVESDNFKLAADGTVTASNVNLNGIFRSEGADGYASISEGSLYVRRNNGYGELEIRPEPDDGMMIEAGTGDYLTIRAGYGEYGTASYTLTNHSNDRPEPSESAIYHRFVGNARFNNDVTIDGKLTVTGGTSGILPRRIALHADGMYPTVFRHSALSGYDYTPVGGEILIAPDANAIYRYHTYSGAVARVYVYQPRKNGITVTKGGAYVSAIMGNFTGYSSNQPPTMSTVGAATSDTNPGTNNFDNQNNSLFRGSAFALVASFQMSNPWAARDSIYTYLSSHKGDFPMLNIDGGTDDLVILVRAEIKPPSGTAQIRSNYIDNGAAVLVDDVKRFEYWASGCWYDYPNYDWTGTSFTVSSSTSTWTVYMAEEFGGEGFDFRVRIGSTDYNPGNYIQSSSGGEWVYESPLADTSWSIGIEASSDSIRTVSGDSSLTYQTLDLYAKPGDIHIKTPSNLLSALSQTQIWRCKYSRFGKDMQVWEKIF